MKSSNPRKYTKVQIEMMEDMRHHLRMSLLSIALSFGTTRKDIERQMKAHGAVVDTRGALRVPYTPGLFNFWGDNLDVG